MVDALFHIAKTCVGVGENILDTINILVHDNRHRHADVQVLAIQRNRSFYLVMNITDKRNQIVIRVTALDIMQDNRKHVRSDTRHTVIWTSHRLETIRNRAENAIANLDGIRGVDGTKAIDIQKGHCKQVVRAPCSHIHIGLKLFKEVFTVINASQSILVSVIVLFLFNGPAINSFLQGTDDANWAARFVALDTTANHKFRILLIRIEQG